MNTQVKLGCGTVAVVVEIILFILKVSGAISISWAWVLSPLIAVLGGFILLTIILVATFLFTIFVATIIETLDKK